MQSLVGRIQKELKESETKSQKKTLSLKAGKKVISKKPKKISSKANIRINKCWNTIRFIAEHDYFANNFLTIVEDTLIPLFEHLIEPQLIDFDDDIVFCLCSLMKKSKQVSPTLRKIYQYLPKFQLKYKGIFGNLLPAINMYIIYGKDFFETSKENIFTIFEMANLSIFKKDPPIILGNNIEGALLLQIALQNLDGPLIKAAIGDILTNVHSRLKEQPMSKTFHRVLIGVFLSAMLTDVNVTLEFLAHVGFLEEFFVILKDLWKTFRLSYERKVYALAISNFIFNSNMPS
jgi:importin-8